MWTALYSLQSRLITTRREDLEPGYTNRPTLAAPTPRFTLASLCAHEEGFTGQSVLLLLLHCQNRMS